MGYRIISFFLLFILASSCQMTRNPFDGSKQKVIGFEENFDNHNHFNSRWEDDSMNSPQSYNLEDGNLKIRTRPQTKDRVKTKSQRSNFGTGTYKWRIFVPSFDMNDQCNIGAFLYHSGEMEYELDFEIGSGTNKHRDELSAKPDDLIVFCTSQKKPNDSERFLIKSEMWHDFKMTLSKGKRRSYLVKWYIDDVLVKTLQTQIKTKIKFSVHNSLENLEFVGEQLPARENYVLFDQFIFEY